MRTHGKYPQDKYIVVQHLQAAGHVTGMTGDGVNDAPALRQAEVGIAVSSAADVAKGKPETWNIGGFIVVSVVLGVAVVLEALFLLWFCWSRCGLATSENALYTFSFLTLASTHASHPGISSAARELRRHPTSAAHDSRLTLVQWL